MFDLILTSFPHFVERFRAARRASEYFRIGFDARVLDRARATSAEQHDVVFVGALNGIRHRRGQRDARPRRATSLPVEFWGYDLRGWPPWSPIRRRYDGEAWGLDMFRLLASSRVGSEPAHRRGSANMRTTCGSTRQPASARCSSPTRKRTSPTCSSPDREVVAYASADDLVEKARHYLADEDERREIAAAGQARTLRDHTYAIRMRELVPILERHGW